MNAQNVVGVFLNGGGTEVFADASTMRLSVDRSSKVMEHPLEDGSMVIDHTVTNPIEAQLVLILPGEKYRDLYSVIRGYFLSRELLTLQTKADSYSNMFISNMPHEETPDMMDAVQMVLGLREAVFFKRQVQTIAPRSTKSAGTTKRGEQAPQRSSVAYDIFGKK